MQLKVLGHVKCLRTLGAAVGLVILMGLHVALELVPLGEHFVALFARERALVTGRISHFEGPITQCSVTVKAGI